MGQEAGKPQANKMGPVEGPSRMAIIDELDPFKMIKALPRSFPGY